MLRTQRWSLLTLKIVSFLLAFFFLLYLGVALYVNYNKKEILEAVNIQINKSINGTAVIGGMEPAFLEGFPGISLSLRDVAIRDSLWEKHKHTLVQAKQAAVSINVIALITGTIRINRISLINAGVYLYTDPSGYSNTSVFKSKKQQEEEQKKGESAPPEINRFALKNVAFVMDNRKAGKLFRFLVRDLRGRIDHKPEGWVARIRINTFVRDLAFNTRKGSFLKEKDFDGDLAIKYSGRSGVLSIEKTPLMIGPDRFLIEASFSTAKDPVEFVIDLESEKLLWKHASALLAGNISTKLNMFDLTNPISVKAVIAGNMGPGSQPAIDVSARVKDNVLSSPGGIVDKCSFSGFYTNHLERGRGNNDKNSQVKLMHFEGSYEGIPLSIDSLQIVDLLKPVASGVFRSNFALSKLNQVVGEEPLKFNSGSAKIDVKFQASVADFQLVKPRIIGGIDIVDADLNYTPRNIKFTRSTVSLHFTENDLHLRNMRLQSGSSILKISGTIKNFMNLYYTAPEKMVLSCSVSSPQLNLGQFFGFLASRRKTTRPVSPRKSNIMNQLDDMLNRSQAAMTLKLDKVIYDRFIATDATALINLSEEGIRLNRVHVRHGGGTLRLDGTVSQRANVNAFAVNARISNVNIRQFFYAFRNFGLTTFTYENLRGYLFSKANITGSITDQGKILARSYRGSVIFDIRKGALLNFEPIRGVGKFAFPFRDLNTITFSNLNGKFDINGEKVKINPMKISSSVLNMDVAGVYSMAKGTNIALDVPLRNPEKDQGITDKKEIEERRMKGIVLHILATDGEDGKIKFKWNKNRD